jgi:hypothetical protein
MCEVCDEFGGLGYPACKPVERGPAMFQCEWCGAVVPDEEAIKYKGEWYCGECYVCEKEDEEAVARKFLEENALFRAMQFFQPENRQNYE